LLWVTAKCLLAGALVAGVVTAFLAFSPMRNPGVQDCGTPLGFVVLNRTDVPITPGAPGAPANARELADQPTCRARVVPRLQQTLIAFAAFVGLALLGSVLGLVDDRLAYHRAPRFESLLRARPDGAPGLLRPPPLLDVRDVGSRLPPIELLDVAAPVVLFVLASALLVGVAGVDEVAAALEVRGPGSLALTALLVALAFGVGAVQLLVSHHGRLRITVAAGVQLAEAWLGRVLPALGPLGLDVHALVRQGVPRAEALAEQKARQWLGIGAHLVAVAVAVALGGLAGSPPPLWPAGWWLVAGWCGLVALVGVSRAPDRWRRLVVRPDRAGLVALRRLSGDPVRMVASVTAALVLPMLHALAFAAAVGLADGRVSFAPVALVALAVTAMAVVAPTPGGVGLYEPLAVLGLVWVGVALPAAVVAVIAYRVVGYWVPLLVGTVASRRLRRRGDL
jgi:uncharacterized membrane protein YbhN (UPF0104 family)